MTYLYQTLSTTWQYQSSRQVRKLSTIIEVGRLFIPLSTDLFRDVSIFRPDIARISAPLLIMYGIFPFRVFHYITWRGKAY